MWSVGYVPWSVVYWLYPHLDLEQGDNRNTGIHYTASTFCALVVTLYPLWGKMDVYSSLYAMSIIHFILLTFDPLRMARAVMPCIIPP